MKVLDLGFRVVPMFNSARAIPSENVSINPQEVSDPIPACMEGVEPTKYWGIYSPDEDGDWCTDTSYRDSNDQDQATDTVMAFTTEKEAWKVFYEPGWFQPHSDIATVRAETLTTFLGEAKKRGLAGVTIFDGDTWEDVPI